MNKCTCCMRPIEPFKRVSVLKTVNVGYSAGTELKCFASGTATPVLTKDELIKELKGTLIVILGDWWPLVEDRTCRTVVRAQGKRVSDIVNTFADDWIKCSDRIPPAETEVLIVHKGKIKIAALSWDIGGVEDSYQPYQYWADPDDNADYEWDDVTHWQPLSQLPQGV